MDEKAERFYAAIEDGVMDLMAYDRKEDEDLSQEDLASLFISGEVNLARAVETFSKALGSALKYPGISEIEVDALKSLTK